MGYDGGEGRVRAAQSGTVEAARASVRRGSRTRSEGWSARVGTGDFVRASERERERQCGRGERERRGEFVYRLGERSESSQCAVLRSVRYTAVRRYGKRARSGSCCREGNSAASFSLLLPICLFYLSLPRYFFLRPS